MGIYIDKHCKDITRLRVESYDKNPIFNDCKIYYTKTLGNKSKKTSQSISKCQSSRVNELMYLIKKNKIDITQKYADWFAIGRAIASEYGEKGREIFRELSVFHEDYMICECNRQYNRCLENCQKTTINTLFYIAKKYGVVLNHSKGKLIEI